MTIKRNASKFLVWRTYQALKEELGEIPTIRDVAAATGLCKDYVGELAKELKSCPFPNRGDRSERVRSSRYQPAVDTFISRGVDKVLIGDM